MYFYSKYSKEKIKLASKPFASGGEAAIYHVVSPIQYKHLVAKIYYPEKRSQPREDKIIYLIKNPPISVSQKQHAPIGWPVDTLYEKNSFVGLLLPLLQGQKLTMLTLSKLPKRTDKAWQRFSFKSKSAFKLRLRLCFNIASTLYQIHNHQNYVLVDLKPDNILVQSNGLISLVDMDSVEIVENGIVLFPAPVATPEYTPPEKYGLERSVSNPVQESWDRFSMAVIFYQLLFGLHPFAASAKAPYDKLVGLDDKIRYGLFVHNPKIQEHFATIPPPHRNFDTQDQLLKDLFLECFVGGHQHADSRPMAEDWCACLINILDLPIQLGGINAVTKAAQNYKRPSSLIDWDKLLSPQLLEKYQNFEVPLVYIEKVRFPVLAEHLAAKKKGLKDNPSLLKIPSFSQLPVAQKATLVWVRTKFKEPYYDAVTDQKNYKILLALSVFTSLVLLGFGVWVLAIVAILPSIGLLLSKQLTTGIPALKVANALKLLPVYEQEYKKLLSEAKEIQQQIEKNIDAYSLTFAPQAMTPEISKYQQQWKDLSQFIQQKDKEVANSRTEERASYQELRKAYENSIQNDSILQRFKTTSYNYLNHKLDYKKQGIQQKIKQNLAALKEEEIAWQQQQEIIAKAWKKQEYKLKKEVAKAFQKKRKKLDIRANLSQEYYAKTYLLKTEFSRQQLEELTLLEKTQKQELKTLKNAVFSGLKQEFQPTYIEQQYLSEKDRLSNQHQQELSNIGKSIEHKYSDAIDTIERELKVIGNELLANAQKDIVSTQQQILSTTQELIESLKRDRVLKELVNRLTVVESTRNLLITELFNFKLTTIPLQGDKLNIDEEKLLAKIDLLTTKIDKQLSSFSGQWNKTKLALKRLQNQLISAQVAKKNATEQELIAFENEEQQLINTIGLALQQYSKEVQQKLAQVQQDYTDCSYNYNLKELYAAQFEEFIQKKLAALTPDKNAKIIEIHQQIREEKEIAAQHLALVYQNKLAQLAEKRVEQLANANLAFLAQANNQKDNLSTKLLVLEKVQLQAQTDLEQLQEQQKLKQEEQLKELATNYAKKTKEIVTLLSQLHDDEKIAFNKELAQLTLKQSTEQQELEQQRQKKLKQQKIADLEQQLLVLEVATNFLNSNHQDLEKNLAKELKKYELYYSKTEEEIQQKQLEYRALGLKVKEDVLKQTQLNIVQQQDVLNDLEKLQAQFEVLDTQLLEKKEQLQQYQELQKWYKEVNPQNILPPSNT